MITMPKLEFMASGGMDGKLILWDTSNNRKKYVYREHIRGIMTLAFNDTLILLFSAGFDHQICIWNPYISTLIHKIQAHPCPIYMLKIIEGTNQLLSMDSEGTIKVIDVRRFNVINSFTVDSSDEKIIMEPLSLAVIPKPLKIAISGHTVRQFEYDKNYVPAAVDDYMAICCKCAPSLLSLYTPVGAKIKVWSLLTGEVDKVFSDITKSEITAFCLSRNESEAIVGDIMGNIRLINIKNGRFEKDLPKHNSEVSFILAVKAMKIDELIITAGMDNEIRVLKENDAGRYDILRVIHIKKDASLSCLAYNDRTDIVIVGTNFGVTGFYEM
jgi:WD40 repeat protein